MEINLPPNVLCKEPRKLKIDKVAALIGENGSGKSTILKSVFDEKLKKDSYISHKVVCFSSGQNESYSKSFRKYLAQERQMKNNLNLNCFYYDKSWSRILIFLATATKKNGLVRNFLTGKDYVSTSQGLNQDLSTELHFNVKVDQAYVNRISLALEQEADGELDTLRNTPYHRTLESFVTNIISDDYNFTSPLKSYSISLNAKKLNEVSFSSDSERYDPIVSFFTQAADNDYFIEKPTFTLKLKNNIELEDLSDGEYQILFLYSLLDLLDDDNTLFLLDEVDSHLHFKNIEKLWGSLYKIKGNVITTTHLLDSITATENKLENLKVVKDGAVEDELVIKNLLQRLSVLTRAEKVEIEICKKMKNIVVMDDYNDWLIFKSLANRKGLDISFISNLHAIKKYSGYQNSNDDFGFAKVDWVSELARSFTEQDTEIQNIFLICDKDDAKITFIKETVQVCGKKYKNKMKEISWPKKNSKTAVHLLAWNRREIENYLISHSLMEKNNILRKFNNDSVALINHLKPKKNGDDSIIVQTIDAKPLVSNLINEVGIGKTKEKIEFCVNMIDPEEISQDINNMYNFIIEKIS